MIKVIATPGEELPDLPQTPIVVDATMVTNIPTGRARPPLGEPWQYYLFGTEHRSQNVARRLLFIITGQTEDFCDAQLVHLLDHHPNLIVEKRHADD